MPVIFLKDLFKRNSTSSIKSSSNQELTTLKNINNTIIENQDVRKTSHIDTYSEVSKTKKNCLTLSIEADKNKKLCMDDDKGFPESFRKTVLNNNKSQNYSTEEKREKFENQLNGKNIENISMLNKNKRKLYKDYFKKKEDSDDDSDIEDCKNDEIIFQTFIPVPGNSTLVYCKICKEKLKLSSKSRSLIHHLSTKKHSQINGKIAKQKNKRMVSCIFYI